MRSWAIRGRESWRERNGQKGEEEACGTASVDQSRRARAQRSFEKQISHQDGCKIHEAHAGCVAAEGIQPRPLTGSSSLQEEKTLGLRPQGRLAAHFSWIAPRHLLPAGGKVRISCLRVPDLRSCEGP